MLLLAALHAVVSARYIARWHCVRVEPIGVYEYKLEVHRVATPYGAALISVENDPFTGYYRGVDTSPEGYALAIRTPPRVAFELKLANNDWLDHITVDGRVIQPPDRNKRKVWRVRLRGGEHFVEIAWKPTE